LDEVQVARLCALAALHDVGKFNLGFQRKGAPEPRNVCGHVREVLALFNSDYAAGRQLMAALPEDDLFSWCPDNGAVELLVASIGHHGRPVRCDELSPVPRLG
jgi:CRISPR-associated endonuclease/helicase Cas3